MPGRPNTKEYTAVLDEETPCVFPPPGFKDPSSDVLNYSRRQSLWSPRLRCNAAGLLALALSTILIILATIKGTIWYERRGSNAPRWRPAFSPFYDLMDLEMVDTFIDTSPVLNVSNPDDIYRLPPSPEVDEAWEYLTVARGTFVMSEADVIRAGKDPKMATDVPPGFGFPEDRTKMMGLDALHQMHCLDVLRKGLIVNYDYYYGAKYGFTPPIDFAHHLDHCLTVLRLHLKCHPDLEPFTFNWRVGQNKPFPDFKIHKRCVNYDSILQLRDTIEGQIYTGMWGKLNKPKDALEREAVAGLPEVTDETLRLADGEPVAWLPGFENKQY